MTDQQLEVSITSSAPTLVAADAHVIKLIERGPFVVAQCVGCGWETFARRSRPLARREGLDHEVLHRPG
jgi:hypothetical protein